MIRPAERWTLSVDYKGAAPIALGLAAIVAALIFGSHRGFMGLYPLSLCMGRVVLLIAFAVVEARSEIRSFRQISLLRVNSSV